MTITNYFTINSTNEKSSKTIINIYYNELAIFKRFSINHTINKTQKYEIKYI